MKTYELNHYNGNEIDNSNSKEIVQWLLSEVKPTDVFIDAGAQIGIMTVAVADQIKPARVIAFEPNPTSFKNLSENVKKYGCNVELVNKAVCDKDGEVEFMLCETSSGSIVEKSYLGNAFITVPCVSLDTFLEGETREVVMKMDIEDAEPLAWKGMKKSFPKFRAICMEIFSTGMKRNNIDIVGFLNEITADGFKIYYLNGNEVKDYKEIVDSFKVDIIIRHV